MNLSTDIAAVPASLAEIQDWRNRYRQEMSCQIIHDSIHDRAGWTQEYLLRAAGSPVGYGSVAIGGPWKDEPTAYEVFLVPSERTRLPEFCREFLAASAAVSIEIQSNDAQAMTLLNTHGREVTTESILFRDQTTTSLRPTGATIREATAAEQPDLSAEQRRWRAVVEVDGAVAATGGVLFHYNPPYGDIYVDVSEPFRRRGFGSFLVQELKRWCRERGQVPGARCRPANVASRRMLEKAGFTPCGHLLKGAVVLDAEAIRDEAGSAPTGPQGNM